MSGREARIHDLHSKEEQRRISKEELLRPRMVEEETQIDSLGGTVVLRSMSHARRQDIRTATLLENGQMDEDRFTMLSIVACIKDPELTEEDITALREQDSTVVDELVLKIGLLNMLGRTDDLKKDSAPTQNSDSPSN